MSMKTICAISCLMIMVCSPVLACAQEHFVGKWQTRTNPRTGKPTITVSITASDKLLSGNVVLVNPNRTQIEVPILNPHVSENTLRFRTNDHGTIFDWWLTLENSGAKGVLHGADHRPAKGGQNGESVIEEDVFKAQ